MRVRVSRFICLVVALVIAAVVVQPAWATLPTPNQPILVVQNSASADPYQNFVPELLTTEGLNGFQTAQLPELTAAFLTNYDLVILPHLTLTAAQATLFQNYVNAGGTLVGFRPDLQLANVFGVASLGTTLAEGWLKIDTSTAYGSALEGQVMKFHGTADRYSLSGASALATLYSDSTTPTASPAAAIYTFGLGKAILFSFDLTQDIVLLRQGNPAWAGYPNNHDGFNTLRASQMFMDQGSGQFWNDLGDGALNDIPQADIQLRLFSNALVLSNAVKRPLPRFWYFPSQNRSLLLMTGDQHGDSVANSISEINTVASFGGKFSEFLWYPFGSISNSQVNTWLAAGHAMGVHFDDTSQVDASGVGGSGVTWSGMQTVLSTALSSFTATYPTSPAPTTTRNHFLIWLSRNAAGSADQTAQAKLFQAAGVELDTTYTAFPKRWGYMTGSGLPMKFLDTATGTVVPVFEQATQYEDDIQLGANSYSLSWNLATAQTHYQKSLSDSLTKYNTAVTMLFHPDAWGSYQTYAQTALQYAQSQSVPIISTAAWLDFWKKRTATALSMPSFTSNTLTFTATGSPAGLTLLVPNASGNNMVSTFQVDGATQSFTPAAYQGVIYAGVVLTAGTHNISVTYAPAARILGQISPSAAAASTSIQVQGGSITQNFSVATDGTYVAGPLPAGTYTVTPSSSSYTFSPSSRSVTLGTVDVTSVNFTGTVNPTGQTLFTTQTPVTTNASDGGGVNYELGTALTSTTVGQITAVRFWKAPNESGTHTGKIWSSTGVLLASVTFANETASGWQQQALTTSLSIAANTTYTVSVNTGSSFYVTTIGGLTSQVVNGNLRSVVGNNGLYGATGQFPTNTYQGSNYFRDIVFIPGSTYSISGNISPAASGSGATVTLSGAASASTTADASGNYTFSGLFNGGYTVTPSKTGFTFSPTSTPVTVSNANVTAVNFTITPIPTFSISGTISPAASGSGATVTLSGTSSATATADASGNYTFSNLLNGSYTVTPSKAGFTLSPTSTPVTVNGANVTAVNFTITPIPTYSISGTISPAASGSGATVTLSGAASASTTADASGNYTFTGRANGSYTVTPSKTGFTFSPTSAPVTVSNANVAAVNFTATAVPTFSISGTISTAANGGGATLTLSGAGSATTTADASGNYTFTGQINGSYTVTPSKSGFTFSPTSLPATVNNANVTGINFTATANPITQTLFTTQTPAIVNANDGVNYELGTALTSTTVGQITAVRFWKGSSETGTHTGKIWSSTGVLLASVAFAGETASGWQQQALTTPLSIAANTTYTVSVNTGNSFYVTTIGGLTSQVANGNLRSVVGNNGLYGATGQFPTNTYQGSNYFRDVVFVPGSTYSISGNIAPAASGSGATVTLSGTSSATATADASGNYTFSNLLNGSYTVTPSKTGFTFSPTSTPVTVSNANVTAVNFTATAVPTYSISGTISPTASGSGATVTLSGAGSATTTADGSGNYTFTGRVNGSYTVTPSKTGFTFSPTSAPVTVSNANVAAVNFTATAVPTFSISGTISTAANGGGATLTLSGAGSATTTADASGNYTFTGQINGSYTVTPSKSGFTFSPTSLPATVNNANVTGINFTATANPITQTLFTTQTPAIVNANDGVNYELGTALTSTTVGQITAVRFWKGSSETGTHTGKIWSSTGVLLASVAFAGETASGWQQQALTTPLSIAANTTYTVSVNTGNSFYVTTIGGLTSQVANGNLRSVVGNNGLYGATGQFPTNTYQGSNYFRDVVFVPGSTYSISGNIAPAASGSGATVTLSGTSSATATADASGNYTFSNLLNGSYTVTPSKTGFTFSPTSTPVTVSNANVTAVNFTATAVPTYSISGTISPTASGSGATVTLSGAGSATTTADGSGNYTFTGRVNGSYTVTPSKSGFTFSPANAPATVSNANVTGINFTAITDPSQTLFTTQTPAITNASDGSNVNYELGTAFTSTVAGQVTAIRFWKDASETGTHTGRIWSSTGVLLASVAFTNETASGWQQQTLAAPLSIAANTTYVASVNTGNTFYVATINGLTSQVVNGNLRSVVGNNGLYGTTGQFPTNTWQGSNYFRDIVFAPTP